MSGSPEVRVGQVWRKSDRELVTITDVEGNTVAANLSDERAGTTAALRPSPNRR
jgi:hypothetical protein